MASWGSIQQPACPLLPTLAQGSCPGLDRGSGAGERGEGGPPGSLTLGHSFQVAEASAVVVAEASEEAVTPGSPTASPTALRPYSPTASPTALRPYSPTASPTGSGPAPAPSTPTRAPASSSLWTGEAAARAPEVIDPAGTIVRRWTLTTSSPRPTSTAAGQGGRGAEEPEDYSGEM
jgi:hypothetical protein